MDKTGTSLTNIIPVYFNRSEKLSKLAVIAIITALPLGLFLWGWYQGDPTVWVLLTAFGVFVGGGTLLLTRKTLFTGNQPVFVIRADGIEIEPNRVLPWKIFKDAVVFTYEGDKMIGLRLRGNLSHSEQIDLDTMIRKDLHYQMFGLPLTVLFTALTLPGEDVLRQFQKHGLPLSVFDQEIYFGQESVLGGALPNNPDDEA